MREKFAQLSSSESAGRTSSVSQEEAKSPSPFAPSTSIAAAKQRFADGGYGSINFAPVAVQSSVAPTYVSCRVKAHDIGGCLAFRPQGNKIVSAGNEGVVKLWGTNLNSGDTKQVKVSNSPVSTLTFNQMGSIVAAGDSSSQISLIKIKPNFEVQSRLQGHQGMINACVFSSDEARKLVSISQDHTMRIWDVVTNKQLKSSLFTSTTWALDINSNDTSFATGHKSGEVKLWSLSEQKEIQSIKNLHRSNMTSLKFTPDCSKLVTCSTDNCLKVIDLRSTNTLFTLEHQDLSIASSTNKFAISPNGKYCVVGGKSGAVFIFNLE